jgi:hypothetical protein
MTLYEIAKEVQGRHADLVLAGTAERFALLSSDGCYRYMLGVSWDQPVGGWDGTRRILDAFMLNPSKADHRTDDTTFGKILHFGKQEGCGGVLLRNLAARRATDPRELAGVSDIIGPHNEEVLSVVLPNAVSVAAWGLLPVALERRTLATAAIAKQRCTHCLGLTKDGAPKHPCRLPHATRLVSLADAWAARRVEAVTA